MRTEDGLTGQEGLHGGTLSQLDWRLSGISGQSRVCAVVQQQPDDWKVVARYGVVERPEEGEKGKLVLISVRFTSILHLQMFQSEGLILIFEAPRTLFLLDHF